MPISRLILRNSFLSYIVLNLSFPFPKKYIIYININTFYNNFIFGSINIYYFFLFNLFLFSLCFIHKIIFICYNLNIYHFISCVHLLLTICFIRYILISNLNFFYIYIKFSEYYIIFFITLSVSTKSIKRS